MSTSNLKISIAALSLCVSAVAAYIYFPYVIAAVSGSSAIEAVPLAIFAVSAIVALVSVICLIRLAVSRAGDKKKIDLSGEESGHTVSQESQEKSVEQDSRSQIKVDSSTSSQDKSSVPTSPSQSPQTRVTASSQVPHSVPPSPSSPPSAASPPPPVPNSKAAKKSNNKAAKKSNNNGNQQPQDLVTVKQDSRSQIKVDSSTSSQDKSSVPTSPSQSPQTCNSIPPPPPPLPEVSKKRKENKTNATASEFNNLGKEFRAKVQRRTFGLKKVVRQDPVKKLDAAQSNKGTDKKETRQEYADRIDNDQEERRKMLKFGNSKFMKTLADRAAAMEYSESESDHSSWTGSGDDHEQTELDQTVEEMMKHTNPPSSKEEGCGLDSGIGSRATSPLYSEQKIEESLVPPSSCVDSPSAAQVNNVDPVDNKVQDPSTSSVKDHAKFFPSNEGVSRSS